VVESRADKAFAAIYDYKMNCKTEFEIKIAGLSFHNTQKIHNMIVGMQTEKPDMWCFLDDDLEVNPLTIHNLVSAATGLDFNLQT
jgi:hypothetical protein